MDPRTDPFQLASEWPQSEVTMSYRGRTRANLLGRRCVDHGLDALRLSNLSRQELGPVGGHRRMPPFEQALL